MEALTSVVTSKIVADDVRHSVGGYAEVRPTAADVPTSTDGPVIRVEYLNRGFVSYRSLGARWR